MNAIWQIEDKHSGVGREFTGTFQDALQSAFDSCTTDHTVMVVWSNNLKPERMAETCLRGTYWISARGRWELEQEQQAKDAAYGNFISIMGEQES